MLVGFQSLCLGVWDESHEKLEWNARTLEPGLGWQAWVHQCGFVAILPHLASYRTEAEFRTHRTAAFPSEEVRKTWCFFAAFVAAAGKNMCKIMDCRSPLGGCRKTCTTFATESEEIDFVLRVVWKSSH